jgi:ribonuclease VapC
LTLVIDTSAVVAILLGEPECAPFVGILRASAATLISTGTMVELYRLVQTRAGPQRWADVDELTRLYGIVVAAMDHRQLELAKDGMLRFGKGRGAYPAVLNLGDLFAYALARSEAAPLLFKGEDFAATDVEPAWRP